VGLDHHDSGIGNNGGGLVFPAVEIQSTVTGFNAVRPG
jgi:hypothetical protein